MNAELKKEQDDFDAAIALSLADENKTLKTTIKPEPTETYPGISQSKDVSFPVTKMVRALFDFEAVEDNELTFKTGEIICIIDDSDVNWWKGSNSRGEGLFPANFVTTDINKEVNSEDNFKRKETENKNVSFKDTSFSNKPLTIDEDLIDQALNAIQNVDPSSINMDPEEMVQDELQCTNMQPIIDIELQQIDKKYNELMELNGKVLNALHMYSSLMKDTPVYTPFKPQDMQYNMQAYINNYAPLDQSFNEQQLLKNTPIDTNSSVLPNQAHNSTNNLLPQGSNLKQNIPQLYSTEDQHLNLNPDSSNQNNSNNIHDYSTMASSLPETNHFQAPY